MRLALVTRRFWPLVGGEERIVAALADELRQLEVEPIVFTAQWEPHWPLEIDHAGTLVHRLPQPQIRGWGTIRYIWSLSRWLKAHHRELDGVIVSGLKYDAYAAIGALARTGVPVLLRAETAGPGGDCQWLREARFGSRIKRRCQQAARIIAASDAVSGELAASGFDSERIVRINNGVPLSPSRTIERRREARAILGDANPDLKVSEETPVALYCGRLGPEKGLHDLVRAWQRIVGIWPEARLFLVGEGPERDDLYDRLRDHELKYHVAMPGAFDDVGELLDAADVFVQPAHEDGTSLALLEAMASGVPIVASDIEVHQELVGQRGRGLLVPIKNPLALAEAIAEVLTLREEAAVRVERARRFVEQQHSAIAMARRHLEIVQELIEPQSKK
jgi:glycosyltransferase involved in cell wall biosynthesis